MSEENIFEEIEPINEDSLKIITENCRKMVFLEGEVERLEESLKTKKKLLEVISRQVIPAIFNESGISELKLSSGAVVSVKDKLKSSITATNNFVAYENMIEAEGGGEDAVNKISSLFKQKLVIEDYPEDLLQDLLDRGVPYEDKKEIHWQTLNKYCRERLESGKHIPEGISCFQYQETSIKE